MKSFNYFQPTEIIFGSGSINQIGECAKRYGEKCLLVTGSKFPAASPFYKNIIESLTQAGMIVTQYDGVIPNPTTNVVSDGAKLAKMSGAQVIIGLGGGSSMDVAKAIAVEASHPGTAWDYLHYKTQPSEKTLPIIAISTTSGTGSQVTQCSVITKTDDLDKSAIWHKNIFPKIAIVDPELMLTLPAEITQVTGFDALAHNFEAYISVGTNPYVETLALEGIRLIVNTLPKLLEDPHNIEYRSKMAWADTLGGICISSAGVTLPHGLGMQISGHCPHIAHGLSLAITYPEFIRFTYQYAINKFAIVGRIFNSKLNSTDNETAALQCCEEFNSFLKKINLFTGFESVNVTKETLRVIADHGQVLSDYKNNPRVATIDDMYTILTNCYAR
ncbi:MAG: iron-containing alcohol dehydrogenase [Oscillospiraceae bacterium]|nr:iron-containing alcohol dehydrogenase [Oscillospiraceae bacterium]